MSGPRYDIRTGEVFIRNYDAGLVTTMGGFITSPSQVGSDALMKLMGGDKENYFMSIPEISADPIPVIFGNPEAIIERKIYPSFLVIREDPVPAMARWHSIGQREYIVPSVSATFEYNPSYGVSGYSELEIKSQDMPYDLNYQIHCYARNEQGAMAMLRKILRTYQPYSKIVLQDSLGAQRSYTAYQESVNDVGELLDVADRVKGYSVSIRIEGELTLNDPIIVPTVTDIERKGHKKE